MAYVISGGLDLYFRNPYANLTTFLLFSGSYIYLSIRARHMSESLPWLPGYYIVFTAILIMASIALMVVVIFPQKGVASIASWLPLAFCLIHPRTIHSFQATIKNTHETMKYIYQVIQRRTPIPESRSPYDWRGNTQAQEIRWEGREEIIQQLCILFDYKSDKRTCNIVFITMKEGDRLLFSKSVEYSEILKFPSTKDFLTACTDGTIDDSTLRSRIQNWNSGNFKVADFSKLLIELKCLYNRIVAPVTPVSSV
ncbi:hypothetical protein COCC4DRAFT_177995 [Bipolaris maydis ATCC 48331]|uniref:Uncharacterized protein n=2 Tax=Cochliobolus heterostrophus TaxID=5016 RepID=M2UNV8_COCH5|nr:uncharacterized protein COCC4DRAFT_177995 [Bipolaris maydis ATCC 48331]EMD95271.1 hypothetical protein COCHEDRAFT_1191974 [Bipolaris maydis C5]KAJ5021888.1 hypothetical protein J3E73DRAFT_348621 [Bipolaris maydis]ENI00837.1 hypothetical protein COCC4DRAFT_177995 [Bipolaris maydis ATCC 48331]KAJ5035191.1 hypothetical protein J3E74DRAFT_398800 [Bipolaris maydis]KAJ5055061.1 hypothetical protein J3E74DRAFT_383380 [Bipolaris maydis]